MTTKRPSEQSLKQEVSELTDLLRSDRTFADIRSLLSAKGLSAEDTILAGLIESEDGGRYGVVITASTDCIRFEAAPSGALLRWETVSDPNEFTSDFQAVSVGIAMQREGEIS